MYDKHECLYVRSCAPLCGCVFVFMRAHVCAIDNQNSLALKRLQANVWHCVLK